MGAKVSVEGPPPSAHEWDEVAHNTRLNAALGASTLTHHQLSTLERASRENAMRNRTIPCRPPPAPTERPALRSLRN
jgi:hypothetical protein